MMQDIKPSDRFNGGKIMVSELKKCKNKECVVYRSSWELDYIKKLEADDNVVWWSSETLKIPYMYNLKRHDYYPDFILYTKQNKYYIIEIKPYQQAVAPVMPAKRTAKSMNSYNYIKKMYVKNTFKWKAALKFCESYSKEKGIDVNFKVVTEKQLYNKK